MRRRGLIRPGWWCECTTYTSATHGGRARLHTHRADTAEHALVWMRIAVRPLLPGFDAEDRERAFRWLDHGQWEAVIRLKAGEAYAFVASAGETRVEWSARPVLFVPGLKTCLACPR